MAAPGDMRRKVKDYVCLLFMCCFVCTRASLNDNVLTEEIKYVKLGNAVTLTCALQNSKALQVTWQKIVGEDQKLSTVATYNTKFGANVLNGYKNRLNVTLLSLTETAITIWKTSIDDEGCYHCIFNVFITGANKGDICLSVIDDVLTERTNLVRLGETVTLKCTLRKSNITVLQVTWQKKLEKENVNVASYRKNEGANVTWGYHKVLNITELSLTKTAITVWKAAVTDEGCYQCLFNAFTIGSIIGETCINVYEPVKGSLQTDILKGSLNATCTASGWPVPVISWSGVGTSLKNGSTLNDRTVTSWLLLNTTEDKFAEQVQCRILHMGQETIFRKEIRNQFHIVSETLSSSNCTERSVWNQRHTGSSKYSETRLQPAIIFLISALVVVFVISLTVVCCRKHRKSRRL